MEDIAQQISGELNVDEKQVIGAIDLLDDGSTIPFIARYRKELTGGLDDSQLRTLESRLQYLRSLEERRQAILNSIDEQGKLTDELKTKIIEAESKTRLEDLYLPYKPKRRTKGQVAREAGLEPLADALFNDHDLSPEQEAAKYINQEYKIADEKDALDGACYILMERFSENAELLTRLREELWRDGVLCSRMVSSESMEDEKTEKFRDYFQFQESLQTLPSHRALAIFRGRSEGVLRCSVHLKSEITDDGVESRNDGKFSVCEQMVAASCNVNNQGKPADAWLDKVVRWTWKIKLQNQIETELLAIVRERAEEEAIVVFSKNLKDLLMAAPAGQRTTLGLDPGFRSGVKVCVVDATGKLVEYTTIFPHPPQKKWKEALGTLATLCLKHRVELVSIGNGTASRETTRLAAELIHSYPKLGLVKVIVSEAGASVYSASELATREFPDLDVLVRGAVSIARRLQDPLAELVKIDPKSIGVGQYQHDVNQVRLMRALDGVVEDCVNAVGVDVNSASPALLARVSGLNQRISENIVSYRDKNGQFDCRHSLKKIDSFGEKTFELSAGFLRISNGTNPLDASSVHPEAYPLVELIAKHYKCDLKKLIGNKAFVGALNPEQFTNEKFGVLTVRDIVSELEKPGRDPRPEFTAVAFKDGVESIQDLKVNMTLEGVVTNVTNFGAFVDVGVHQDGLVHISVLSEKFVKDPREMVKVGEIVKVKVLAVDSDRKRISLTMRLNEAINPQDDGERKSNKSLEKKRHRKYEKKHTISIDKKEQARQSKGKEVVGSLASAFARAKELRK